jgi:glycosyltransferase involved in cell wall biosynthesis
VTSFRIYGPVGENDSLSRVAAGMADGLRACGKDVSFFDLRSVLDDDDGLTEGFDADIGIYTGPLSYLSVMARRGQHKQRLVAIFPNSSWLPPEIMADAARTCTGILAATAWGAGVIREHSLGLPVMKWRLGVDEAFAPAPGELVTYPDGRPIWNVLHLSSTRLGRKGTGMLIGAWALAQANLWIPRSAELSLVLSGDEAMAKRIIEQESNHFGVEANVKLLPRLNLAPSEMAAFYRLYDLLAQPSRAEGFGLCPLEARACGVPVAATACTGHSEHMWKGLPGVVTIEHGDEGEIDDGPGALAPNVALSDIASALWCAYDHREELEYWARAASERVRTQWSWKEAASRFLCDELGE